MVRWSLRDPLVSGTTAAGIGHLWANDIILGHVSTCWSCYRSVGAVTAFAGAIAAFAGAIATCVEAVAVSTGAVIGIFG